MKLAKLATLVLAPLFLASVAFAAPMTVSVASDNVTVVVNGKATALKAGATVPAGATVKVAKGASARVTLPDGTVVGLGEGASFSVKSSTEEDGVTSTVASLSGGAATVQANLKKGSSFTLETPAGTISGIKGTVTVTATASTMSVTATQERWRVAGTDGKVSVLAAGQTIFLTKDNPNPAPRPATRTEKKQAELLLAAGEEDFRTPGASAPVDADPFGGDVEIDGLNLATIPENSPSY